jgi:hypothetical protein
MKKICVLSGCLYCAVTGEGSLLRASAQLTPNVDAIM